VFLTNSLWFTSNDTTANWDVALAGSVAETAVTYKVKYYYV